MTRPVHTALRSTSILAASRALVRGEVSVAKRMPFWLRPWCVPHEEAL